MRQRSSREVTSSFHPPPHSLLSMQSKKMHKSKQNNAEGNNSLSYDTNVPTMAEGQKQILFSIIQMLLGTGLQRQTGTDHFATIQMYSS